MIVSGMGKISQKRADRIKSELTAAGRRYGVKVDVFLSEGELDIIIQTPWKCSACVVAAPHKADIDFRDAVYNSNSHAQMRQMVENLKSLMVPY